MQKVVALLNVVAWSGFWAFGYLALTGTQYSEGQMLAAVLLAFAGLIGGVAAYLYLARAAEASGYAGRAAQLDPATRARAHEQEAF